MSMPQPVLDNILVASSGGDELTLALRNRIQNLEARLDQLPVGIMIVEDNRSDQITVNRYVVELLGENAGDGIGPQPLAAKLRIFDGECELQRAETPLQRAAQGEGTVPCFEGKIARADGQMVDVMILAKPLLDEENNVRGSIAAIVDDSRRKSAERHERILLFELQHRVKNIITTISALAKRMLKGDDLSLKEDFAPAFLGRLRAMALTHQVLSGESWEGASLCALVDLALRPHLSSDDAGLTIVEGPDLMLTPNAAMMLGQVVYELTTNATKYGALSDVNGRIELAWRVNPTAEGDNACLTWTESHNARLPDSISEGFGITFIKRGVEYEMNGSATLELRGTSLQWTLEFPLEGNTTA